MGNAKSVVALSGDLFNDDKRLINTDYKEANCEKYSAKQVLHSQIIQKKINDFNKEESIFDETKSASDNNVNGVSVSTIGNKDYASNVQPENTYKDYIMTYSRLINMGFEEGLSLEAANKYSQNINKAINYIETHKNNHSTEPQLPEPTLTDELQESIPLLESVQETISDECKLTVDETKEHCDTGLKSQSIEQQHMTTQLTDDMKVKAILKMGYDEIVATTALQVAGGDLPEAIKLIIKAKAEVVESNPNENYNDIGFGLELNDGSCNSRILSLVNEGEMSSNLLKSKQSLENIENDICGAITPVDESKITVDDIKQNLDIGSTCQPIRQRNSNKFEAYVGIDFGSDGTGFACAFPSGEVIGQQNYTKHATLKERTNILLEAEPPYHLIKFGLEATKMYSELKDKTLLYFDRFKMKLHDQVLIVKVEDDGKENVNIKKQYFLKAVNGVEIEAMVVFERALEEIKKSVMKILNGFEIRQVMKVQWILTVPSIWSNYVKELMKEAAEKAGIKKRGIIDHLIIATEPECISIIATKHIQNLGKLGTKYIMLDLGGGTAEISCHKTLGNNEFKQIYAPEAGKWGSNCIDIEYEKLLDDIFGKEIIDSFKINEPNKWIDIQEKFRKSKHRYDGSNKMNVDLNNSLIKYIENNHAMDETEYIVEEYKYKGTLGLVEYDEGILTLEKCVWIDLFKCVVEPIMEKTCEVLERKEMEGCKDILLSGGLCKNKYVRSILMTRLGDNYSIHTAPRPISAVAEGAAMMGLNTSNISAWYATESIGLQVTREYDSKIDNEKMKRYDSVSTKDVVDCGFASLIKKGTLIDENKFIIKWFRPWKCQQENKIILKLYSSENGDEFYTIDSCVCEGEATIELPSDWGNKKFPLLYWDKGSEKRLYIAHPDWKDEHREIKIKWSSCF